MSDKKLPKEFKYNNEEAKKDEGNNQWTNNNLKYYPDTRERRDGPGGEDAGTKQCLFFSLYEDWRTREV